MLTWTQESDGWYTDGFRIELRAPRHWVLVDLDSDLESGSSSVTTDLEPLAEETTLTHCKREAAILVAARQRSATRWKHARILLLTLAATILLLGQSVVMNAAIISVSFVVAFRSLGALLGTLNLSQFGRVHEIFYQ